MGMGSLNSTYQRKILNPTSKKLVRKFLFSSSSSMELYQHFQPFEEENTYIYIYMGSYPFPMKDDVCSE